MWKVSSLDWSDIGSSQWRFQVRAIGRSPPLEILWHFFVEKGSRIPEVSIYCVSHRWTRPLSLGFRVRRDKWSSGKSVILFPRLSGNILDASLALAKSWVSGGCFKRIRMMDPRYSVNEDKLMVTAGHLISLWLHPHTPRRVNQLDRFCCFFWSRTADLFSENSAPSIGSAVSSPGHQNIDAKMTGESRLCRHFLFLLVEFKFGIFWKKEWLFRRFLSIRNRRQSDALISVEKMPLVGISHIDNGAKNGFKPQAHFASHDNSYRISSKNQGRKIRYDSIMYVLRKRSSSGSLNGILSQSSIGYQNSCVWTTDSGLKVSRKKCM